MTDEQLAEALNIPIGQVMVMSPDKRNRCEVMVRTAAKLNAWQRGEGPKPEGVLVDGPRPKRRRR